MAMSCTAFLRTKASADAALRASGIDHVILRPALVVGPVAYGGTALLRALAAFPGVTPLVFGASRVRTVSVRAVADATSRAVSGETASGSDLILAETGRGLTMAATFRTDLFDRGTVRRMLAQYEDILADLVADPGRPLSGFRLS